MSAILSVEGAELSAVALSVPRNTLDNLETLGAIAPEKAAAIVKTTGVSKRRIVSSGAGLFDLCESACGELFSLTGVNPSDIGAVVSVSFTSPSRMPGISHFIQSRFGLGSDVMALDLSAACAGYIYGLYTSALLARETGKSVVLIDGDVQSAYLDGSDVSTLAVLADGATASLVSPSAGGEKLKFSFETHGEKGGALKLQDSFIRMDGFGVFKFVASDVVRFAREFISRAAPEVDAFIPHQPNVYMVNELARCVGIDESKVWRSADKIGNISSASIPATIALNFGRSPAGQTLNAVLCGFGGGLSIGAAKLSFHHDFKTSVVEYGK